MVTVSVSLNLAEKHKVSSKPFEIIGEKAENLLKSFHEKRKIWPKNLRKPIFLTHGLGFDKIIISITETVNSSG